ncbi:MAG: hypothetical protein AAF532_14250 [Planctomycetota bacterium]
MHRSLLAVTLVIADAVVSGATLTQCPPWPITAVMAVASLAGIVFAARTIGDAWIPRG